MPGLLDSVKNLGKYLVGAGAGTTLAGRLGRAGMYLGAGYGGAAYIEQKGYEARNYYGSDRYDAYFGSGFSSLAGTAKVAGMFYGASALVSRDPIARVMNTYKYNKAKITNAYTKMTAPIDMSMGFPIRQPVPMKYSSSDIKNLKSAPRVGPLQAAAWSSALGVPALGSVYLLGWMGATTVGGVRGRMSKGKTAASAVMGYAGNMVGKTAVSLGRAGRAGVVAAGAGYLGYTVGTRNNNTTAEGTITEFDRYNSAGVSRMNFSTAGLVQALHNNNRKF